MLRMLLVLSFLFSFAAQAARIAEINVSSEHEVGSTKSQTIEVNTLVDEKDPALRLELKAFYISGEAKDKLTLLHKAPLTVEMPKVEKPGVQAISRQFRVPLADLAIPAGEGRIGYVASLLQGEDVLFELASEIQLVEVEGKKVTIVEEPKAGVEDSAAVPAYTVGEDGKPRLTEQKVTVFPAREEPGTVTIEAQEAALAEAARKSPHALAGIRTDIVKVLDPTPKEDLVYFATNRSYEPIKGQQRRFKWLSEVRVKGLPSLTWGAVKITLPTRQKEQSWWSKEKAVTGDVFIWNEKETLEGLSNSTSKDVFLFIHGYCNSFDDVILQAGRMKRDLVFKGNVMAFSWPSAGNMRSYDADEAHAENTTELDAFAYVLHKVVARTKAQGGRVYVMAHSMGNRFLVHGLRRLYLDALGKDLAAQPKADRTLAMVAFAAPDVDLNLFTPVLPNVVAMTKLTSFYYSTKDKALGLSHQIHSMTRAGLHPVFNDDVATINTDKLKGWFSVGHSYYSSSDRSILDLYLQIHYHRLPALRVPPLEEDAEVKKKRLFEHWYLTAK